MHDAVESTFNPRRDSLPADETGVDLGFELFIARRYLRSRRRENFISFISLISIVGVAIGVATLNFVMAMMNGFETEIRQRIIDTTAHITVYSYAGEGFDNWKSLAEKVNAVPDVVATAPNIFYKSVIGSGDANDGVFVKGIDPNYEFEVSKLRENIVAGEINLEETADSLPGIVIGRELAGILNVKLGGEVVLASLKQKKMTLTLQPKYKKFVVTGIFETGMNEYDGNLAYISIPVAQDLFKLDNLVTGLQVRVRDFYKSQEIAREIEEIVGSPYYAVDWSERHKNLFGWMTLEKYGMSIVVGLIVAVAAFNIVTTLIMLVIEKRKDIAIFKSMGANRKQVMKIFMFQGTLLGFVGTIAGTLLGFVLCWAQQTFNIVSIPGEIYFINSLPIDMRLVEFAIIAGASVIISFLATLYPSRRAARLFPSDILRHG
ncbi:MAG: lipoprotein-releasing ABC transporter permease subunit [bacterium]|nr:lipoprotein-releasing ABC transporter permease subunit [bacterium]